MILVSHYGHQYSVIHPSPDCNAASEHLVNLTNYSYLRLFDIHVRYYYYNILQVGLSDSFCKLPMALTAENLAEKYKIPREKVDEFALRSQQLWKKANDEGVFKTEITPFKLKVKGKEVDFAVDEHPRPQTTLEGLNKLPSLFKKGGAVTAGTASVGLLINRLKECNSSRCLFL